MNNYFNREFFLSNKKQIIKAAAILLLVVVAFLFFVFNENKSKEEAYLASVEEQESVSREDGEGTDVAGTIMIDVGGAVKLPQVAELKDGCRIVDAISAAGGLKENADLSNINQAAFLTDGEKVYIPAKGEDMGNSLLSGSDDSFTNGNVNINTASSIELQTLNGVGPATAEKILDFRKNNGNFKSLEDLKKVSGIGDKTFEKLKDHISI